MTDPIHEQLSAFLDGELSAAESELLLKRIERDSELKTRLERYVLAGEALRARETQLRPSRDFVARVAAGIDTAPRSDTVRTRAARWIGQGLKPVAGGAIAAGVAAVVLVSLRSTPTDENPTLAAQQSSATQTQVAQTAQPRAADAPLGSSYVVPSTSPERTPVRVLNSGQLANYVVAHSAYASPLRPSSVLSGLVADDAAPGQSTSQSTSTVVEIDGQLYIVEQLPLDTPPPAVGDAPGNSMLSQGPR